MSASSRSSRTITHDKEDREDEGIVTGAEFEVGVHTSDFGILESVASGMATHSNVCSIYIVEDVHDPEHGEQMSVDFPQQSPLLDGIDNVFFLFDGLLELPIANLIVSRFKLEIVVGHDVFDPMEHLVSLIYSPAPAWGFVRGFSHRYRELILALAGE